MDSINSNNSKKCSTCRIIKDLNEFHKNSNECKSCKFQRYVTNKDKYFPKVDCNCGRIVFKHVFEVHLSSKVHKRLTEGQVHSNLRMIEVN